MNSKKSSQSGWLKILVAGILAISSLSSASALAGGHQDVIPMSQQSWSDVRSYMNNINRSYTPSPGVRFNFPTPQNVISEKTAVGVLNSVRDSLEDNRGFEPWIFEFINMSCGLPCDGT